MNCIRDVVLRVNRRACQKGSSLNIRAEEDSLPPGYVRLVVHCGKPEPEVILLSSTAARAYLLGVEKAFKSING